MKRQVLPKKTLLLWQIRVVMLIALLIAACIRFNNMLPFLNVVAGALGLLCLIVVIWYLPTFFKGYELLFQNEAVIINYGVFIKFSHIMPYSRLIYAQTFATPLARLMGLAAFSLKAARSRVIIPEVLLPDALKVLDSLTGEVQYDKDL